jgi:hypothetical protein
MIVRPLIPGSVVGSPWRYSCLPPAERWVSTAFCAALRQSATMDDGKEDMHDEVREQDRFLPIANISRIMKKSLPANAKIAKDAKETVQECVSEFISFITSEGESSNTGSRS